MPNSIYLPAGLGASRKIYELMQVYMDGQTWKLKKLFRFLTY